MVLVAGLIVTWRPWERQAAPSSRESPGSLSSSAGVPLSITTVTTTVQPLPTVSPKEIDQVLLTTAQLSKVLGVNVTSNPAGGAGALALKSSSYGTSDHSGQVTPRSCVGLVFTGEHDVYTDTDYAQIKTQIFDSFNAGSSNQSGPDLVEQTAAVFSSPDQAQRFLKASQDRWNTCGKSEVDATLGYENVRAYKLGKVQLQGDLITVQMASPAGEGFADACQQAMGVRENVIVEARTCGIPNVNAVPGTSDPDWATRDAERVAKAMLANVGP
ncbi:sensor domain-containing protein [Mycobacterium seoulense]|uniref:sensor domain-containing protein n=1 Tax=Mycobacterium seoulense TaxID=386911 RepID=UPI003CE7E67A